MVRIRVTPEQLELLGCRLQRSADDLRGVQGRLGGALGGLGWEVRQKAGVDGQVGSARNQASALASELEALARYLAGKARAFEDADRQGVADIGTVAAAFERANRAAFPGGLDALAGSTQQQLGHYLQLGAITSIGIGSVAPVVIPKISPLTPKDPGFAGVDNVQNAEYTPIEGVPFIQGAGDAGDIDPSDVEQGALGDCYFVGSLAALARANPEAIRRLIQDNGDGTYTVTLYEPRPIWDLFGPKFRPLKVVVDADFPALNGNPVFAGTGDQQGQDQELWVALLEKAYAQKGGGYAKIEGGSAHDALEALTGVESRTYKPAGISIEKLAEYERQGSALTVSTFTDRAVDVGPLHLNIPDESDSNPNYTHNPHADRDKVVANHVYYVTHVDAQNGTVTVANPWGPAWPPITLPFDEFQKAFADVTVNPTHN